MVLEEDIALFISRVYNFAAGTAIINEIQRPVNFCKSKTETVHLMTDDLKSEIISWRFLDSWTGKLEWKKERHLAVNVFTDSSLRYDFFFFDSVILKHLFTESTKKPKTTID
jgi:hypothetical protein